MKARRVNKPQEAPPPGEAIAAGETMPQAEIAYRFMSSMLQEFTISGNVALLVFKDGSEFTMVELPATSQRCSRVLMQRLHETPIGEQNGIR